MALKMDVVTDGRTERLIRVAKATRLTSAVPKESGATLVNLATAVREFALAHENTMALSVLTDIMKLVRGADDPELVKMFDRHVTFVRKALTPTERS